MLFLMLAAFAGCEPDDLPTQAAPGAVDVEAAKQTQQALEAQAVQVNRRVKNELQLRRRKGILKALGNIASWQVSTQKDGKVNDEIVKLVQSGTVDKVLTEAFTDQGLELKNFIYLPEAIKALRHLTPRPEYCDFLSEDPIEFDVVKDYVKGDIAISDDKDARVNPLKWFRDIEVSIGVVDNRVAVVRVHSNAKTLDWQMVRATR
jgi:hypothetical protein